MSATVEDPRLDLLTKRCPACDRTLTWRHFHARAFWQDGTVRTVRSYCRECVHENSSSWKAQHPDRDRAFKRQWKRRQSAERRAQRDTFLKAEPLRVFLEADGRDLWVISELTETSWDTISRLIKGHSHFVKLSNADRIITRMGGRLDDVYPLEDEGAQP